MKRFVEYVGSVLKITDQYDDLIESMKGENNQMDYEFHVGDYVETKDSTIGYISSVLATGDAWWMCTNDSHGYYAGEEYGIMHDGDLPHCYNRIGQYDFTKPEQPKEIVRLMPNGWNIGVSGDNLIDKINELVDAVNELREKSINE